MNFQAIHIGHISSDGKIDKASGVPHGMTEILCSWVLDDVFATMEKEHWHDKWIDFKRPRPQLIDVEREWDGHVWAESPLFYNAPWCSQWVHGPDIILPVIGLAEKMLWPDEHIKQVTKLQFLRLITHDATIHVYDQSIKTPSKHVWDASTSGLLETSNGRTLRFDVIEDTRSPVSEKRWRNPISDALSTTKVRDWVYSSFLDEKTRQEYEKVLSDFAPLRTSTILEILTRIASHVFHDEVYLGIRASAKWTLNTERMVAKVTNMPSDIDLFSFTKSNGITAKARLDKIRTSSSGRKILPIEFHFSPESKKPCVIYFAYKVS